VTEDLESWTVHGVASVHVLTGTNIGSFPEGQTCTIPR
jgi:hypothetical protein